MKKYLDLMQKVLTNGEEREDRTGTGTLSLFGETMRFDLQKGFPLVTTRKMFFTGVVDELLWFLSGSTNIKDIPERSRHWWSKWADEDGRIGPIYGFNWRNWPHSKFIYSKSSLGINFTDPVGMHYKAFEVKYIDQIKEVIKSIKDNPQSRRHIVSAWNVALIDEMALPPCHILFQFYVSNDKKLSCQLYQRSADVFLGLPANIASYSLLTHMIAQQTGLEVGEFIWTGGDVHLYKNHIEQAKLQLSRNPLQLPQLKLNKRDSIDDYVFEDVELVRYESHPAIKAEISV